MKIMINGMILLLSKMTWSYHDMILYGYNIDIEKIKTVMAVKLLSK